MQLTAAAVVIWHTSIVSFLSFARMVCLITSTKKARNVTGLPNKRLEKSVCSVTMSSSWSSGTVACGIGAAPMKGHVAWGRSTVDFGRGGKTDYEVMFGTGGFLAVLCALQASAQDSFASVFSLSISVTRWYLGQIVICRMIASAVGTFRSSRAELAILVFAIAD